MKNVERLLNNRILRVRAEIDRLTRLFDQHGQWLEQQIAEAKTGLSWLMHLNEQGMPRHLDVIVRASS